MCQIEYCIFFGAINKEDVQKTKCFFSILKQMTRQKINFKQINEDNFDLKNLPQCDVMQNENPEEMVDNNKQNSLNLKRNDVQSLKIIFFLKKRRVKDILKNKYLIVLRKMIKWEYQNG